MMKNKIHPKIYFDNQDVTASDHSISSLNFFNDLIYFWPENFTWSSVSLEFLNFCEI